MNSEPSTRWPIAAGIVVALVATFLLLSSFEVRKERASVDKSTGSRKGDKQWFWGGISGRWYKESAVESFMRSHYPAEFRQNWESYAGTGKDVFGRNVSFGHGRPGAILLLTPETINAYCEQASAREKRRLYDVFSAGNREAIANLSIEIDDVVVNRTVESASPGSASPSVASETNYTRPATDSR